MLKIAIIMGSTRPGRNSEGVAKWVHEFATRSRSDVDFEIIDLKDYALPYLDEIMPAAWGQYSQPHTLAWSKKIDSFDGYIFVTPEYNHSTTGVLKNAIDFLYKEWNNKAVGYVGYGVMGAVRAVEHLRLVMGELQAASVSAQVGLSFNTDFENYTILKPHPTNVGRLNDMLQQLITWSEALKSLRLQSATLV